MSKLICGYCEKDWAPVFYLCALEEGRFLLVDECRHCGEYEGSTTRSSFEAEFKTRTNEISRTGDE